MRGRYVFTGVMALFLSCKLFGPEEKAEVDWEASKEKSEEAGRVLEEGLSRVRPEAPPEEALAGLDLDQAMGLYEEALELDPSNSLAHFGMAITELLSILADRRVQDAVDSLSSILEGLSVESSVGALASSPIAFYGMARRAWPPGAAKPAIFRASDLQEVVEQEMLPGLGRALGHLEEVEKDEDFRVYVRTRSVQPLVKVLSGPEGGPVSLPEVDSLEVDLGEVYTLDAQVRLARAFLLILTSYNLDFDYRGSYELLRTESDSLKLVYLRYLDEESSLLTLRSGGNPSRAKSDLLTALEKFGEAVAFIRAEDDPQEDDIIKKQDLEALKEEIGEDAPEFLGDVETIEGLLAKVRQLLSEPLPVREDFDHDGEKEELLVNLSAWLDLPPQDLKAFLPYHRWYPENFGNDNFYDDLVLTDAQLNPLGKGDPPFVLPDPSFGGIFPQFGSNEEFLSFFGMPLASGPLPVDPLNRSGGKPPLLSSAGRTE
ncbi:MAG TPA: hypothetical protein EYP61_00830 [Candidatus Latescibacteria bacterium]|nr:hypothetical protein [Candidatus Latescibacterota bacterium]